MIKEEEQRREAYIESKMCLEYIIDQVEIDINEIYISDILFKTTIRKKILN